MQYKIYKAWGLVLEGPLILIVIGLPLSRVSFRNKIKLKYTLLSSPPLPSRSFLLPYKPPLPSAGIWRLHSQPLPPELNWSWSRCNVPQLIHHSSLLLLESDSVTVPIEFKIPVDLPWNKMAALKGYGLISIDSALHFPRAHQFECYKRFLLKSNPFF